MYDAILVGLDGSETAASVLDHALTMANALDATLHVVFVADTARDSVTVVGTDVIDALEHEGECVVREAADRARAAGVTVHTDVLQGRPAERLVAYAEAQGVDAIVVGTHGRRGLPRYLLGSVAERVVRTAGVPVVTVGPDALEESEE